jgi:hypothetical protein
VPRYWPQSGVSLGFAGNIAWSAPRRHPIPSWSAQAGHPRLSEAPTGCAWDHLIRFPEWITRHRKPVSPALFGHAALSAKVRDYRKNLQCAAEHRHVQYVVETYKYVKLKNPITIPGSFDRMQEQQAGAFSTAFSRGFDVVRPQLGIPYDDGSGGMPSWIPLRRQVEKCIDHWKSHFRLAA